jgi:hypothetical protein
LVDEPDSEAERPVTPGCAQICIASPELRSALKLKYIAEVDLVPMLLRNGLIRRVRTLGVEVCPLGGQKFTVRLEVSNSRVADAKVEIARIKGVPGRLQHIDVEERAALDHDHLEDGAVLMMRVKDEMKWEGFDPATIDVSEGGMVAEKTGSDCAWDLVTSSEELMEGKYYWEVEVVSGEPFVGVARPGLDWKDNYISRDCSEGWFINTGSGALFGNGKHADNAAGAYNQGDRVGILLDLGNGSLRFFRNGKPHGNGYPPGSVAHGPVLRALHLFRVGKCGRLLAGEMPAEPAAETEEECPANSQSQ